MKSEDSRFQDYYTSKLLELTAKTQNDFYSEVAQELIQLRRKNEAMQKLVAELADQIKRWEKYQREVNYAVDTNGSYKP